MESFKTLRSLFLRLDPRDGTVWKTGRWLVDVRSGRKGTGGMDIIPERIAQLDALRLPDHPAARFVWDQYGDSWDNNVAAFHQHCI